jgi:hypothetical protein
VTEIAHGEEQVQELLSGPGVGAAGLGHRLRRATTIAERLEQPQFVAVTMARA